MHSISIGVRLTLNSSHAAASDTALTVLCRKNTKNWISALKKIDLQMLTFSFPWLLTGPASSQFLLESFVFFNQAVQFWTHSLQFRSRLAYKSLAGEVLNLSRVIYFSKPCSGKWVYHSGVVGTLEIASILRFLLPILQFYQRLQQKNVGAKVAIFC